MSTAVQDELLRDVQVEKNDEGEVTLQIEVTPEAVAKARQDAIRDYARRIKVPGFRPGHAPANIVRRQVGDEAIAQALSDKLINEAYQKAVEQEGLRPLVQAQVSNLELDAFNSEAPMKFQAQFVARPDIDLGEIEGIEVEKPVVPVTDADVEKGLEALRSESASFQTVTDRGAKEGDVLNAELQVYQDGEPRGEEPANLRAFVLGESGFVPAIDEHLVGANIDEERRFPVTYPEDFQDAELAGKEVEFAVKVTALRERILPELNDEFAVKMGVEDVAAMNTRMREMIQITRGREADNYGREQAANKAIEGAKLDVPYALVHRRVHDRLHHMEHELEHQEKTMEQYLEENSLTSEQLHDNLMEEIGAALRRELVLDEIARIHELKVSEEEFEGYYMQMAQALNQPADALIERLDAGAVHASLLRRKAIDWLYERAKVTETEAPAEAA